MDQEDVLDVTERMVAKVCKETVGLEVPLPLKRMTWDEAMNRFGSDKPSADYSDFAEQSTASAKHAPRSDDVRKRGSFDFYIRIARAYCNDNFIEVIQLRNRRLSARNNRNAKRR